MKTFVSPCVTRVVSSEDVPHQMIADAKMDIEGILKIGSNVNQSVIKNASMVFVIVPTFVSALMDMKPTVGMRMSVYLFVIKIVLKIWIVYHPIIVLL